MNNSCQARPPITAILSIALLLGSAALPANQDGITDDGREVLLKEDGTWAFRSSDRYANTKDGDRVRLKSDNTWEYVGNAPLTSKEQVRTTILDIQLHKVIIEVHKEKVQKNVRKTTQTVFFLKVSVSPAANDNVTLSNSDLTRIMVRDDKGKNYTVISTTPSPLDLAPNSEQSIAIRAEGSPSIWDGAKSMALEFSPGILGIQESLTLHRNISDMEKKNVDGFE